ncbi:DUF3352 domain-containing protein [Candidatus Gracilibacteria bacterium]|nr:DUF3352 domain-containing protein [Candidatus Gracilibacteria bacterium]MCF7819836.1 DUF3352 domain-containing protein [Candidatus Gracilibacteria bacterium]
MKTKKKSSSSLRKKFSLQPAFWVGVGFFLIGLAGLFSVAGELRAGELDQMVSSDATLFVEFSLDQDSLTQLQHVFPEVQVNTLLDLFIGDRFGITFAQDIAPWIGHQGGIALFSSGEGVVSARYQNRKKLDVFLQKFKLPSEAFQKIEVKDAEILTPAFSSGLGIGIRGKYVFFASSVDTLKAMFQSPSTLSDLPEYRDIRRDMPRGTHVFLFSQNEPLTDIFFSSAENKASKPLWAALSQSLPFGGVGLELEEKTISMHTKMLTEEGVFAQKKTNRSENQTMPELAQFAPQNTLFFMNGADLYAKYQHTKEFLAEFHPQFSVLFDGVLRATSRQLFGDRFDFERDFLSRMHGQYAFILNFKESETPFLDFTLVTGFGGPDAEKNLSQLHDIIHFAQTRFAVQEEEVELPDGSTRQELVAVDAKEIPIQKQEFEEKIYFTAENVAQDKNFSYAFLDGYLVFSTTQSGIKSVFTAHGNPTANLTQNTDFRESVLFRYSPSESYGFLNLAKLGESVELLTPQNTLEESEPSAWQILLRSGIRNMTFARKVFPGEIFWTGTLFLQ